MRTIRFALFITAALVACQPTTPDSVIPPAPNQTGQSVLIYSNRQYNDSYQVTEYDANGIPVWAKTSVNLSMGVMPSGTYTSLVKLEYDEWLRLKKTTQVYDQLGYASCCPGFILFDPARQVINEYTYQGTTRNITHEVNYILNPNTRERTVLAEYSRSFTIGGSLTQEKQGDTVLYEATYDANDNVVTETIYPASAYDKPAFTRRWTYEYDGANRILSRTINDSNSFERNTYDSQGQLLRRVTNIQESANYTPTVQPSYTANNHVNGSLIDYRFRKLAERSAMSFSYFTGQFLSGDLRVATYAYGGDLTIKTEMTYQFWTDQPATRQPGFDFAQLSRETLMTSKEKTMQLSKDNRIIHEAFRHVYVSDKLTPERLNSIYASKYSYTYDESGNLTSSQGSTVSPIATGIAVPAPSFEARYKRL